MEICLETKLFEAAAKGNINSLQKLLNDDPLILDRVSLNCFSETPLHVATLLGHIDFVKEIISIKPELTSELNLHQSSPLHLASAKGHVDVVRALLSVNPRTCLARDRNGLTPLHLAAIKGRLEVLKVLLEARRDAARVEVYRGENILHLCVKYYQLEALKLLVENIVDPEFINGRDIDGNTVLHLAVADKQVEAINFLMSVAALEVNALNLNGMTALDVLIKSRRDVRDSEIKESLTKAGIFRTSETNIPSINVNQNIQKNSWKRLLKQQDDWLEKKRSALMVVASLIATMAFQIGMTAWSTYRQSVPHPHAAGLSVMARNYPKGYPRFYIVNTTGFIASLKDHIAPDEWIAVETQIFYVDSMVITWIAITMIALTYALSITMLTPPEEARSILYVVGYSVFVWVCSMVLLARWTHDSFDGEGD
ncbi:hypothetical protein DH2020_001844 [Rehmannia glutinosa]|uniref:PGG domain-containing protein n=1 Tax=Rehmannia glutinosa TaxID=99300 RepID=A0ABR0XS15_REHGL